MQFTNHKARSIKKLIFELVLRRLEFFSQSCEMRAQETRFAEKGGKETKVDFVGFMKVSTLGDLKFDFP